MARVEYFLMDRKFPERGYVIRLFCRNQEHSKSTESKAWDFGSDRITSPGLQIRLLLLSLTTNGRRKTPAFATHLKSMSTGNAEKRNTTTSDSAALSDRSLRLAPSAPQIAHWINSHPRLRSFDQPIHTSRCVGPALQYTVYHTRGVIQRPTTLSPPANPRVFYPPGGLFVRAEADVRTLASATSFPPFHIDPFSAHIVTATSVLQLAPSEAFQILIRFCPDLCCAAPEMFATREPVRPHLPSAAHWWHLTACRVIPALHYPNLCFLEFKLLW
ncbi:hypothetical protein C8R43DRAFT_943844 [Mycena crocata]|nr:hypothetical protein C8R43DRAFT_943844 [Mycena crocata]